jgi:hypothetical protein
MKFLDFLFLLLLLGLLAGGIYFLWLNFPTEPTEFETFVANYSSEFPEESTQFHPNMRYPDSRIGYKLADTCTTKKRSDFIEATEFLSRETILSFYESTNPDILVSCSNIAPEPDDEGHFVAGEGGPTIIINASQFAVITLGKIALYRPETCDRPQVAIHELLHALGFDHNSNPDSLMYPVTNCDQTLDQEIKDQIRTLYSIPSAADLLVESVKANKTGRYLSVDVVIANHGLKDSDDSTLLIYAENSLIKDFELEDINIGSKKTLSITNIKVPRNTETIKLAIETTEKEISRNNNEVQITLDQANV